MPLIRLNNLRTLNNVARPNLLAEDELQECENYEVIGNGNLALRKDPETFDSYLDTALDAVFSSIISISEPYYPQRKLSAMYGDYILLVYGHTGSAYVLYYFYQSGASAWTGTQIAITGHAYDSGTELEFTIGESKVIITDLDEDSENHAAFFRIDPEGTARSGILGIPAPKSKAAVTQITAWDESDWDTNADSSHVSEPGLVQVVYTVVTEDGQESNPSPVSETLDMQFFEYDSEGDESRWIGRVLISNLSIPTVSEDVKDQIKYFNVYYRVFRYSEGKEFSTFQFAQQFEIIDKTNADDTTTGNNFAITVATSPGEYLSYSNNIAPVAKVAAEVAGVPFLANIRDKIHFPFNFYYYCPIKITNTNNKHYVDAVILIKLQESDIDNLEWDYYNTGGSTTGESFEDDFEDGDFSKWDAVGSDWSVQDSVVKSGDYSALCDVTAWESENAKLELSGTWKNFVIEGDIRVNQKYGVCQKATVGGRSDTTGYLYYALSMRPGDDGHFQYYDGTAFYNFPNDKTWAVDTWYHFRIEFDFANGIQRTWVDDDYLGPRPLTDGHGILLDDNRYFEKISFFGSSGWESGHDYLYLDNVEIANLYPTADPIDSDKIDEIRLYDSDLTTPLNAIYQLDTANNYCKIFVKIPLLEAGNSHTIYLCFNNASHALAGVDNADYQTFEYGKWMIWDDANFTTDQKVYSSIRVKNQYNLLCCPVDIEDSTIIYNKSNVNYNGAISSNIEIYANSIAQIPVAYNQKISTKSILNTTNDSNYVNFGNLGYSTLPDKITVFFFIKYDGSDISTGSPLITFDKTSGKYLGFGLYLLNPCITYYNGSTLYISSFSLITLGDIASTYYSYFILFSYDQEKDLTSAFVINLVDGSIQYEEITFTHIELDDNEKILIGTDAGTFLKCYMDQISIIKDIYYSASDTDNINTVVNIANFMPAFDDAIGYKYSTTPTFNNNITFGDTETITYKEYRNMLRWGNIGGFSFGSLYYKNTREPITALLPAPSFLKLQYANTVVIFSRNYVYRFVLIGTPDEWRARSESLIEDHTSYGLLARESLVKVSNMILWLSEFGVILWNETGINLISKDILDITLKDTLLGFFCPIRNQYILHDNQFASVSGNTFTFATNKISFPYAHYWTVNGFRIGDIILVTDTVNNNKTFLISAFSKTNYDNDTITVTGAVAETPANCTIRATRSYVFDFNNGKVSRYLFSGLDISKALILSGGTASENVNLFLSSVDISVNKYPGATATTAIARLLSRLVYLGFALVKRIRATFTGSVSITVKAWHRTYPTTGYKTTTFSSPTSTQWRGITNGNQRAREVEVLVENASTLESIDLEVTPLGN